VSPWLRIKRRIFRVVVSAIMHTITKIDAEGMEKINTTTGTVVLASNHLGRMDALLTLGMITRDDVIIVVAEKYRKSVFIPWMVKQLDLLFLQRFEADFGTLKEVLRRLRQGGILAIAPEGTRSPNATLLPGKPGVAFLAAKSGATVIPVGVTGSEDGPVKAAYSKLRRPVVRIRVGEPFKLPEIPKDGRDEYFQEQTDNIMLRIAALLPKEYRGVYADHPNLAGYLVKETSV
jgi:1-acyl-sn-glycerol-3-phosphate acyltransferase